MAKKLLQKNWSPNKKVFGLNCVKKSKIYSENITFALWAYFLFWIDGNPAYYCSLINDALHAIHILLFDLPLALYYFIDIIFDVLPQIWKFHYSHNKVANQQCPICIGVELKKEKSAEKKHFVIS